jgi:putative transposase
VQKKPLALIVPLDYYPEFLTATILRWQNLLVDDNCKQIVIDSLEWLVTNKKCKVYAFVIMPNHIHLLWKISDGFTRQEVQGAFFSFTAHEFKKYLKENNRAILSQHHVDDGDRVYQFWERDSLAKECFTQHFIQQKMEYIHQNPCKPQWNLATIPEEYKWSSASFCFTGDNKFPWLSHIKE